MVWQKLTNAYRSNKFNFKKSFKIGTSIQNTDAKKIKIERLYRTYYFTSTKLSVINFYGNEK